MQDAGGKRKCTSKVAGEQIAMVCNCGEVDLAFVPPCTAKDVRLMCMSKKAERFDGCVVFMEQESWHSSSTECVEAF